jgi:pyruvate/2-oxoglutarate dehydrogenase complex dihydrolipoamide dehydrogenase (E3) component
MSPHTISCDFAVIGGGSAGFAAARTAHALGLRTAVIDGAEELGGLCILRGCMPSKSLIESADRALTVRRGSEFGLASALSGVNTRAIRDRKRALIAEFAGYREEQLTGGRFELVRGAARFDDAHTLVVSSTDGVERRVRFKACLIATGSTIFVPEVPGLAGTGFWTSDTALDAAEVPASFVVLGGGAIALELAHFFEGIGRRVTVIQRSPHLLTGMDVDVADEVRSAFVRRGIEVHCGTRLTRVARDGTGTRVEFESPSGPMSAAADEILVALGRRPALAGLHLDRAGLAPDADRLDVRPTQQTARPHIFAAGDASGPFEIVHLAVQQGEIAARNAARVIRGEDPSESMDYRLKLFGVFTHPQAAQVGLTESEARREGREVRVATHRFDDHGKSMVMGETDGFVKLIADPATGRLLGGSAVGPEAVELIHPVVVALHFRATAAEFLKIPFYHPTLSEIWTYPAETLAE